MNIQLTAVIQAVKEGGYIAFIEEFPGVNTQGETVEEAKENLFDALKLSMEYHREKMEKVLGKKTKGIFREKFEFVTVS